MPSETSSVHVIDDDEAMRQSMAFLLKAAKIDVQTYEVGRRIPRSLAEHPVGMRGHRRAHARHERHCVAAASEGNPC